MKTKEKLTPEIIWAMFAETDRKFAETDRKFAETDKQIKETDKILSEKFKATDKMLSEKFKATDKMLSEKFEATDKMLSEKFTKTDKKFKEIFGELGGIGKSNGEIAEDFFATALEQNMQVANLTFDFIDFNLRRKRKNTEAEYDIILYNNYKVLIIEVKYNFKMHHLRTFYEERMKKFRTLFPEYSAYKVYGGIAALSFDKNIIEEAKNYGFYVLKQNNDKIKIANKKDFVPNNIK